MKRAFAFVFAALLTAGVLGTRWLGTGPEPPDAASAAAPAVRTTEAQPVASAPPARADTSSRDEQRAPTVTERRELVRSNPMLQERARQHELAAAADARWEQAVDSGAYRAEDLDPAVRDLFTRLDLEPRYAEGGRIDGLVIQGIAPDHPLALAGFRAGDLIESIQGTPLSDPADIPSVLAHLGPHVTFCADREGAALCRELDLAE